MTLRSRSTGRLVLAAAAGAFALVATGPRPSRAPRAQAGIEFEREYIRVLVRPTGIRVDGTYYFENKSPVPRVVPLFYPFPVDSLHPWPTHIAVYSQEGDTLKFFRPRMDGILFRVELPAAGVGSARVVYDQPSFDGSACYILTTTRAWQQPLARADFEIRVPAGIELTSITYDVDEIVETPSERTYFFRREKFMPTENLCLEWVVR
jgi:hypothetical protein